MEYTFTIPHNGNNYFYYLLRNTDFQLIDLQGTIYLIIAKYHTHKYEMQGFNEKKRRIIYSKTFTTKKELYDAIQKLLQEDL